MSAAISRPGRGNRLAGQSSPYLLQHADNPVDWYPWGEEAFAAAKKLNRPIFLSIGYSTCHWCHVMAHESFSNERIAAIMNKHFISIKVDREQRPDVDAVYMNAVQMMTGGGGWPLSVFLTPEGKPFFGGTYYPPDDRQGRTGFDRILLTIAEAWDGRREEILQSAERMRQYMMPEQTQPVRHSVSLKMLEEAAGLLSRIFDAEHGGFGGAPKFPQPSYLSMLMTYWRRSGDGHILDMVTRTLDKMAKGGIHDHLGGGFHRYSVDAVWLAPHFEKMLYDQALLGRAYLEAYQITGNEEYAEVARDIIDYVLRDMRDAEGGFYSAEDADSEGREGVFYLWRPEEIRQSLKKEEADLFVDYYGVTEKGNFEGGATILSVTGELDELAERHGVTSGEASRILGEARKSLFAARVKRSRPHRDEKIIAGWNGLMISSLAMGGRILGDNRYTQAGRRGAEFVLKKLRTAERLRRFYFRGKSVGEGFADDYAFLTAALLDLYEADYDARWLEEAMAMADGMTKLFADGEGGGLFMTGSDAEELVARTKPSYDGAVPSANSVAARAFMRLGQITMKADYTDRGVKIVEAFSSRLKDSGPAMSEMLRAVDFYVGPRQEIVIAGEADSAETREMLELVGGMFLPTEVTLLHPDGRAGGPIEEIVPFIGSQRMLEGQATAYICENYVCRRPVRDLEELKKMLASVEKPFMEKNNAADTAIDM